MHNSTISLFKKLDIEYLMLDGIQRKPYRNLDEIQDDILTFLEFKFPIDTFKDDLEQLEIFLGKTYSSRDEFLKHFLQSEIIEYWWDLLEYKRFDFSIFNNDKEYLFKIGVLFREDWQKKLTINELIAENLPGKMNEFISYWFWNRIDKLSMRP